MLKELTRADWLDLLHLPDDRVPDVLVLRATEYWNTHTSIALTPKTPGAWGSGSGSHSNIDPQGDGRRGMPQPLLDNLWVDPLAEQVRGMAMPQIVKADPRDLRPFEDLTEISLSDVVAVKRLTVLTEHKAMVRCIASRRPKLFDQWGRKGNGSPTFPRLGLLEHDLAIHAAETLLHRDHLRREMHVLPTETQQLTLSHSCEERRPVQQIVG